MRNGSIFEQVELQTQTFAGEKKKDILLFSEKENNISCNLDSKQDNKDAYNHFFNELLRSIPTASLS